MKTVSIHKYNTYRQEVDMHIQDWVQLPRPKEMAEFRKTLPGHMRSPHPDHIKFKVVTKVIVTPTMEKSKYEHERLDV